MYRFIAFFVSASIGGVAAWLVYINLDEVVSKWLTTFGFSAGTFLVVTALLYFPLFRHVGDIIEEQLSTLNSRFTARQTGLNLNDIPQADNRRRRDNTSSNQVLCSMCGASGGPICESCADKMSKR